MAIFNLFKINETRNEIFKELYNSSNKFSVTCDGEEFILTLYTDVEQYQPTSLSWNWLLTEAKLNVKTYFKQPKAILYLVYNDIIYALSFGSAFYDVDKYCDKDFAFNFARKFKYKKIKSTSQAIPSSNRNKIINSYVNNEYFEYDTGGAYLKIKGQIVVEDGFDLFKNNIEVGTSIKFSVNNPSFEKFIEIVKYVSKKLEESTDQSLIPLFQPIRDKDKIEQLNSFMYNNFDIDSCNITFSDFDIIGTNEYFYSQSAEYRVYCDGKRGSLDYLSLDKIKEFCLNKNINYKEKFFDIYVKLEGENKAHSIREFIDYPIENENAVLIKGEWYQYNSDFINSLDESLNHLNCIHDKRFDWNEDFYKDFINSKKQEFKLKEKYKDYDDEELVEAITKTFYKERVFNEYIADKYNFICGDRVLTRLDGGNSIELNDLYKDNCIYAVKIGNSSGKLCYCVDQMVTAMNCIKNKVVEFKHDIKEVCIVLLIKKRSGYPEGDDKFDITSLKYIALKNALNSWMKEARNLFYEPKVIIGYTD